jgi:Type II intron maturase/Reverse transcriptase (RNA-dependent DNA polymerase)
MWADDLQNQNITPLRGPDHSTLGCLDNIDEIGKMGPVNFNKGPQQPQHIPLPLPQRGGVRIVSMEEGGSNPFSSSRLCPLSSRLPSSPRPTSPLSLPSSLEEKRGGVLRSDRGLEGSNLTNSKPSAPFLIVGNFSASFVSFPPLPQPAVGAGQGGPGGNPNLSPLSSQPEGGGLGEGYSLKKGEGNYRAPLLSPLSSVLFPLSSILCPLKRGGEGRGGEGRVREGEGWIKKFYSAHKDVECGCLANIDNKNLITLIENKILDRRFTHLINKALKAGFVDFNIRAGSQYNKLALQKQNRVKVHNLSNILIPNSVISPILINIYLDQLDKFVESLIIELDKETIKNGINRSLFPKLNYLRFGDNWILGINATYEKTMEILSKFSEFCKTIGLSVNKENTKITNINKSKAFFLGTLIGISKITSKSPAPSPRNCYGGKGRFKEKIYMVRFEAPISLIKEKLKEDGFATLEKNKSAPKFLWLPYNHDQIIKLYNKVFRYYLDYYSFVHNKSRLVSLLNNILKQSCAKLLAAKFKLSSRAKVFKKFGSRLTSPNKRLFLRGSQPAHFNFEAGRLLSGPELKKKNIKKKHNSLRPSCPLASSLLPSIL